jgi:uncharacterized membrane protein YfcA
MTWTKDGWDMVHEVILGAGALAAGIGGGLLSGLFGIGGGIVLVPLLGLLLGLSQHQAQGVTLAALLLPNGLPAVLHFRRRGIPIPWILVLWLTVGFLPSVWAGARLAARIPDGPLRAGFGILLVLMALRVWFHRPPKERAPGHVHPPGQVAAAGLLTGVAGGLASGLLGIGGGLIIIPLLGWSLDLSQHEAQAACLAFMLAPIGLPGVFVYAQHQGGLPWLILGGVAAGFLVGATLGARLATTLRSLWLRRAFAVLMASVAIPMLIKAL